MKLAFPETLACNKCATHLETLSIERGIIGAAIAFFATAMSRHISPWQAVDDYLAAFHVNQHAELDTRVSDADRMTALYDDEPPRYRVTADMVAEADSVFVESHVFEPFLDTDVCQHGASAGPGYFCGKPRRDGIHER